MNKAMADPRPGTRRASQSTQRLTAINAYKVGYTTPKTQFGGVHQGVPGRDFRVSPACANEAYAQAQNKAQHQTNNPAPGLITYRDGWAGEVAQAGDLARAASLAGPLAAAILVTNFESLC